MEDQQEGPGGGGKDDRGGGYDYYGPSGGAPSLDELAQIDIRATIPIVFEEFGLPYFLTREEDELLNLIDDGFKD